MNENIKNTKRNAKESENYPYDSAALKKLIVDKLHKRGVANEKAATPEQLHQATVYVLKEMLEEKRIAFKRRAKAQGEKKVCYLCMEFLVGRQLKNNVKNMSLYMN